MLLYLVFEIRRLYITATRMTFSLVSVCLYFSQVYWIGDLNYRLSDVENDMVKNLISTDSMQVLMDYDQVVTC